MSRSEPVLLLGDILESIEKIKKYTSGISFQEFINDDKTKDAVVRNFEIIGDAATRFPQELKERFPHIQWQRIRGFRNRIVHDYMGVDYRIVWTIIDHDLTELSKEIVEVMNKL
jgi:uncharacterized protein with HEPN domain